MMMRKMGRGLWGGLLLGAALIATGCSEKKRWSSEDAETENMSDTRPIAPPQAPAVPDVPAAPPAPIVTEKPRIPPPAEAPSAEAQMQDDADASGMTAPVQSDDGSGPPANQN
ncbi:hypothetical protein ACSBM8_08620 [Sphingomonas sp. ASY06-1R]|uniref:hypothetical protein n=1 Tax=Sphingomonas sp. ASY06-1R TaxID=3445771 RepID=UPI003FA1D2D9